MKSNKLLTLSLGFLVLGLAACGTKNPEKLSSTDEATSDVATSETPAESSQSAPIEVGDNFAVYVVYPDGTAASACVEFLKEGKESFDVYPTPEGVVLASFEDLKDDEYTIHLKDIPQGYTYNPNIYKVTKDANVITVNLVKIETEVSTKTLDWMDDSGTNTGWGKYESRKKVVDGVHSVTISDHAELAYYSFDPKEPGIYEFESWAEESFTSNPIDPIAKLIGTSSAYQFDPQYALETYDNNEGSKNFKFRLEVSNDDFVHADEADENGDPILQRDENGNLIPGTSWTYVMSASASTMPVTYAWSIKKVGEYVAPVKAEKERVQCTATKVADEPKEDETFEFCAYDGTEAPVYNPEDGFYHLNTATGPLLYIAFTKDIPGFGDSLYMAAAQQGPSYYITDGGTKTYEDCFDGYRKLTNSDGMAYVTQEVKEMLTGIAYAQTVFSHDGLDGFLGTAADGCEWLFAVGYYKERAGLKESNPIWLEETYESTVVEKMVAGRKLYFAASSTKACQWIVKCANDQIEFDFNGTKVKGGDDMSLVLDHDGDPRNVLRFSMENVGTKQYTVTLQIAYSTGAINTDPNNLIVGTNKIDFDLNAEETDGPGKKTIAKFTAPVDGEYYLSSPVEGAYITWKYNEVEYSWDAQSGEDSDSVTLKAGDVWELDIKHYDVYTLSGTVYFDINKKESAPTGNSLKVGENVCTVAEGEFDNSLFGKVYTFTAPEAGTYNFSTNDGNC